MPDISVIKIPGTNDTINIKDSTLRTEVTNARPNGDGTTYQNLNARITNIENLIGSSS